MRTNVNTIGQGRTLIVTLIAGVVGTLAIAGGTLRGQTTEPAPVPPVAAPEAPASAPTPEPPAAVAPAPEAPAIPAAAPESAPEAPPIPASEPAPVEPAAGPMTMPPAQAATGFSEDETLLIKSVTDGGEYWQATPMYILLKHAALLPDDNNLHAEKLDLNDLWDAPAKYREKLKPLTFEGWYAGVCNQEKTMANDWWPTGTFHLMRVCVTTDKNPRIVLVALTKAPAPMDAGTKVRFTGYFYKNAYLPLQEKQSEKRYNPILIAKAAEIGTRETPAGRPFNSWGIVAAIVTLLGLGLYFQMRVRASRQQAAMHVRVQALTHQPEEDADFDVDPDLAQEVERFEAEQEAAHHPTDAQKAEEK